MLPSSCFLCVVKNPCANLVRKPGLCKVCAGRAWGLCLTLDGLCESCAAELGNFRAGLLFVCTKLTEPCTRFAQTIGGSREGPGTARTNLAQARLAHKICTRFLNHTKETRAGKHKSCSGKPAAQDWHSFCSGLKGRPSKARTTVAQTVPRKL